MSHLVLVVDLSGEKIMQVFMSPDHSLHQIVSNKLYFGNPSLLKMDHFLHSVQAGRFSHFQHSTQTKQLTFLENVTIYIY